MVNALVDMGKWINKVDEAIFDSVPYWVTSTDFTEPGQPLYFMQSKNGKSFYIFSFERPLGQRLIIKSKIPLYQDSKISLFTKKNANEFLNWKVHDNGRLVIDVPDSILDTEKYLWVFKMEVP